ncbi:MAG: uroporphyrinogen-III synthase [Bdellovibrionales bacterium]|nr:uroporphyrinogen-III synthase [Bdellovibrionales bacterium]
MFPLQNKRILVTRQDNLSSELIALLVQEKAIPTSIPMIQVRRLHPSIKVEDILKCNVIVFTSQNAVGFFHDWIGVNHIKLKKHQKIICIGPKTERACRERNMKVYFTPKAHHASEEMTNHLENIDDLRGEKVLFPKARETRKEFVDSLRLYFSEVVELELYETVAREDARHHFDLLRCEIFDWITFFSPSAVKAFWQMLRDADESSWIDKPQIKIASIGQITSNAIRSLNWKVTVECTRPCSEEMVDFMKLWERKKNENTL